MQNPDDFKSSNINDDELAKPSAVPIENNGLQQPDDFKYNINDNFRQSYPLYNENKYMEPNNNMKNKPKDEYVMNKTPYNRANSGMSYFSQDYHNNNHNSNKQRNNCRKRKYKRRSSSSSSSSSSTSSTTSSTTPSKSHEDSHFRKKNSNNSRVTTPPPRYGLNPSPPNHFIDRGGPGNNNLNDHRDPPSHNNNLNSYCFTPRNHKGSGRGRNPFYNNDNSRSLSNSNTSPEQTKYKCNNNINELRLPNNNQYKRNNNSINSLDQNYFWAPSPVKDKRLNKNQVSLKCESCDGMIENYKRDIQ
eukprot:UN27341